VDSTSPSTAPGGARDVAAASLLQQVAQVCGLLVLLLVVTVLARRLSAAELGTYGLVATLAVYLLILKASVGSAAVRAMASARGDAERVATFSTCAALYAVTGLVTGALVALAGFAIAAGLLDGELAHQARLGAVALGAVTAAGLAATINLDALRASLLLTRSAANEIAALVAFAALMLGLVAADADLWLLIAGNGSIPLISGTINAVSRFRLGLPWRFEPRSVTRRRVGEIVPVAGPVLVIEVSTLVIYGLDRVVLGAFGSAATVGLYEGPVRAHNVLYALNQALGVTSLPVASSYRAAGQAGRLRELALRGSRYTLAVTVPLVVTAMVLAAPVLEAWLGERYRDGAPALAILVSYWLLLGQLAVTPNFLVGSGRAREAARIVAAVAALNLVLSIALTPSLGLEGPALGTAISYVAGFPLLLRTSLGATGIGLGELARTAWLPAYALGLVLASILVAARTLLDLDSPAVLVAALFCGPALYWAAYGAFVLRPDERVLVREVLRRGPARPRLSPDT
jgi:O-antigen/teichoic acid export membrane protein